MPSSAPSASTSPVSSASSANACREQRPLPAARTLEDKDATIELGGEAPSLHRANMNRAFTEFEAQ